MKAKELNFTSVLNFNEDDGIISFKGTRFLLIDSEAMGLLRREIVGVLGLDMARRLLTRYGYACGFSDALRLHQEYNWDSEEEWMMAGPMMHMFEGIVQVKPAILNYSRSEDNFRMEGEWNNSYEAEQHLKQSGLSDSPVCWTLTGYASGYATAFFDRQVLCVERACVGKGDKACSWVLKRPHQLGFEAQQGLQDLQGFNLAGTINMLEEQIATRTAELSALNTISTVLAESLSLDELLNKVLPYTLTATGASFGRVFLLNESGDKLELHVQTEPDPLLQGVEPAQLHVTLPVGAHGEWGRLKAGNLVVTNDIKAVPFLPELSRRHNWRTLVRVPLSIRGALAGVLELASQNPNWPAAVEEKRILNALGRQIGMALGNARLYEQEQQRTRAWRGLVEISHKVAASLDKQQVLESLVEYARELLDSELSFVALLDDSEGLLEMAATSGARTKGLAKLSLAFNKGLTREIIQTGKPLLVSQYQTEARLGGQPTPEVLLEGIVSLIAVPLTARGRVLGILYVARRHQHNYTEADADLLIALATQAAISVENAHLHEREIARMKEVERIKADFLAMITHELRTPLTNIKGISSGLLQPDIKWDEASQRTFLEAINEESDILTALVSNLLDMSRMEAGAWTISLEICTLEEIILEVKRKLLIALQGVELLIELEPNLPKLWVDPTQIGRVLINLLSNAIKYGQEATIYLSARVSNPKYVMVSVRNEGPAISTEDRTHIFEKFYRGNLSESPHTTGAGLGLAIVKGIVEAHGGHIWLADSFDNRCTTFCFTLPIAE